MHIQKSNTGESGDGARRTDAVILDSIIQTVPCARFGCDAPPDEPPCKKGHNPTAFFVPFKISDKQRMSEIIQRGSNWVLHTTDS